jgi:hypothetical protein
MNRAIARQSSPIVVSLEQACHAGGRGFESRRSRFLFAEFRVAVVEGLGAAADPTTVGVLGVRRKVCQRVLFPASLFQFFSRLTDARRTCRRLHE